MKKKLKFCSNNKKIKYIIKCQHYESFIEELLQELQQNNYSTTRIKYWQLKFNDIRLPL